MVDEAVQHRIETLKAAARMPSLIPLAEKPLLLTLMATLHTSRGQLPHDRATLYADCVDLLLEVWQRDKDLHIGGKTTIEGGLLDEADRLLSYLQRRAGLLEYEGDEAYRFPHRAFQEFLAACYLLDEPEAPASLIQWFLSDPSW